MAVVIILIVVAALLMVVGLFVGIEYDSMVSGILICFIGIVIIGCAIFILQTNKPLNTLRDHMDEDKTHIIEDNGKVVEMDIVVDGEKYHFDFKKDN